MMLKLVAQRVSYSVDCQLTNTHFRIQYYFFSVSYWLLEFQLREPTVLGEIEHGEPRREVVGITVARGLLSQARSPVTQGLHEWALNIYLDGWMGGWLDE